MKAHSQLGALTFDGSNVQALAHGFEHGKLQKVFHGFGKLAETVFEFLANILLLFLGGHGGDALVGAQAEIFAGDVLLRDADVHAEVDGGALVGSGFGALELGDGALEHLDIEVEADGFDVAVLLATEHVAGTTKFEVESGNSEAGAEFAELFHGGKTLAGDFGEDGIGRNEEISVGTLMGTANAAAELVKLGKTETY